MAGFLTLIIVSVRTLEAQWNDSFRKLYDEFWKDADIAEARRMIAYQAEYEKIKPVLQDMVSQASGNARDSRSFSEEEMDSIENVDQFCAKLLQIMFTSDIFFFQKRQMAFKEVFSSFWDAKIEERRELHAYIRRFWPTLANQIDSRKPQSQAE